MKDFEEIVEELSEDNFLKEILKAKPAIDLPQKHDISNRFDDEDYDIMLAEYLMQKANLNDSFFCYKFENMETKTIHFDMKICCKIKGFHYLLLLSK